MKPGQKKKRELEYTHDNLPSSSKKHWRQLTVKEALSDPRMSHMNPEKKDIPSPPSESQTGSPDKSSSTEVQYKDMLYRVYTGSAWTEKSRICERDELESVEKFHKRLQLTRDDGMMEQRKHLTVSETLAEFLDEPKEYHGRWVVLKKHQRCLQDGSVDYENEQNSRYTVQDFFCTMPEYQCIRSAARYHSDYEDTSGSDSEREEEDEEEQPNYSLWKDSDSE